MQQVFSLDGDMFYENIDDIIDKVSVTKTIYVGEKVEKHHKDFININYLIEQMQELAYDVSEYSEGYLEDITIEHKNNIEKIILEYMNKYIDKPKFYEVINIKEILCEYVDNNTDNNNIKNTSKYKIFYTEIGNYESLNKLSI